MSESTAYGIGVIEQPAAGVRTGEPSQRVDLTPLTPPAPLPAPPPPVVTEKSPWLNSQAHITLSGLAMFVFMAIGIIWPQYKPKADELAVAAGTYLFASAKAK